jgi:phospholipid transport system substrate-binding protein
MRAFPLILVVCAVLTPSLAFSSGVGATAPSSPTPWLKGVVEKGRKLAERKVDPGTEAEKKLKSEIRTMADDVLDWEELTKQALGSAWEQRNAKERSEFSSLLREMIEASYESRLRQALKAGSDKASKVAIDWTDESVNGEHADAIAHVKSDKSEANLGFKLRWIGDRWRVFDVAIDDVSTVRTYRSQFGKIIANQGFPALIERMRKKVGEIRAGLNSID